MTIEQRRSDTVAFIAAVFDIPERFLQGEPIDYVIEADPRNLLTPDAPYDREAHLKSYDGSDYRAEHDPPDEWDLTYWDCGYSWCRPCVEWHRLPECPVDTEGYALDWAGQRWDHAQ